MIDVHIHAVPPNLPGVGSLAPLLREPPEVVAAELRREMQTAGVTHAFAMGQWDAGPDDPRGDRPTHDRRWANRYLAAPLMPITTRLGGVMSTATALGESLQAWFPARSVA